MVAVSAVPKHYALRISAPAGSPLTTWLDLPELPALHLGLGGTPSITLTLRRPYGRLDEPGEPGGFGSLAWGNRVDVVTTRVPWAEHLFYSPAVGTAIVGRSAVGQVTGGPGQVVWAGTIEDVTPRPPDAVDVAIVSVEHKLDEAVVPGTYDAAGDPQAVARDVVTRYCQTLTWDSRNPATSGFTTSQTFQNQTVRSILGSLANAAGANVVLTVTPRRTVRFFTPDTTTADHTLVFGTHIVDAQLGKIGNNRVRHVVFVYGPDNAVVEVMADGWTPADGREAVYSDSSVTDETVALGIAANLLAGRDLITLRAQVVVLDAAYPLERLHVGDTVNLLVPSAMTGLDLANFGDYDVGTGGVLDYAQFALIIVAIDDRLTTATLTLSEAVPSSETQIVRLSQQLAAHLAGG